MTPTFLWVFLLALVGRTASVPRPLTVDACALLCNPGAETEAERERDPVLYPRYPKVNCRLQSHSDEDQAWVIASKCLKLCNEDLSINMEVNCFALRSSLGANLGCFCEALTPLSPNTMRLHESWRLNFLVKELAKDILEVITLSDLDTLILCDIRKEIFTRNKVLQSETVKLYEKCKSYNDSLLHDRKRRSVDDDMNDESPLNLVNDDELHEIEMDDFMGDTLDDADKIMEEDMIDEADLVHEHLHKREIHSEKEEGMGSAFIDAPKRRECSAICKNNPGVDYCHCDKLLKS